MNVPAPTGVTVVHIRNIVLDIILTLITLGIWNLYVQYKQMVTLNTMMGEEKYNFVAWFFLSLITCGLYHIYHEYRKSGDLVKIVEGTDQNLPLITVVLSLFGLSIVADAIQQSVINAHFGSTTL